MATFYSLLSLALEGKQVFDFSDKGLLDIAQSHILPMIMAMALYLWDVLYCVVTKSLHAEKASFWILLMIIVFMVAFVFSFLVNTNEVGWFLFIAAWLALTVLKYQTTAESSISPYQILED